MIVDFLSQEVPDRVEDRHPFCLDGYQQRFARRMYQEFGEIK